MPPDFRPFPASITVPHLIAFSTLYLVSIYFHWDPIMAIQLIFSDLGDDAWWCSDAWSCWYWSLPKALALSILSLAALMSRTTSIQLWAKCRRLLKGRISPFLFLKEKLFQFHAIFTVYFIKYKKYSHTIECENVFFFCKKEAVLSAYLQQPWKLPCPSLSNNSQCMALMKCTSWAELRLILTSQNLQ